MKILNSLKNPKRKERRKEGKNKMSTMTSLQELLQCEEDSFIPDELDDKLYDDNHDFSRYLFTIFYHDIYSRYVFKTYIDFHNLESRPMKSFLLKSM